MAKVRVEDIIDEVLSYSDRADVDLIRRAYVYSGIVHKGQTRLNGEPYLVHPIEVAQILAQLRMDEVTIAAGLLHDAVEDTHATLEEVRDQFGDNVAELVDGVTKIGKMHFKSKEERQAENFRKLVLAMSRDLRVIMIKLADRLHNMRTLRFMDVERQQSVAQETLDIYAPLANRIGINWMRSELEDLAFRYLWPQAYQDIRRGVAKGAAAQRAYVAEVVKALKEKCAEWGIDAEISGRTKHLYSIYLKMERQNVEFDQVHDVVAFRVIVDNEMRCYEVLGRIHGVWPPVPGRFKDYVAMPKQNGYQSLHTTVIGPRGQRIEVQIRTQDMHRTAEQGIAAHWVYKEGARVAVMSPKDEKNFAWMRALIEARDDVQSAPEYMEALRYDLFEDEVYVITPKGDVQAFPRGATPVDLAYRIHTELGHQCAGAKVNGRIVPLNHQLQNGDTVEILRDAKHRPNREWLSFVVTSAARTKIRAWLKAAQRARSIEFGREKLEREARRYGAGLARSLRAHDWSAAAAKLKLGSADDLFASVGYGRTDASKALAAILPPEELQKGPRAPETEGRLTKIFKALAGRGAGAVKVAGVDDVLVRFGRCCSPLPGEPIVGFITRGRGVTIHAADCEIALAVDQARMVDVEWDKGAAARRRAKLKVVSVDRPGLLNDMTAAIASHDVNIAKAIIRTTKDSKAVNDFDLEVTNLSQLHEVMRSLESVRGVLEVQRG